MKWTEPYPNWVEIRFTWHGTTYAAFYAGNSNEFQMVCCDTKDSHIRLTENEYNRKLRTSVEAYLRGRWDMNIKKYLLGIGL